MILGQSAGIAAALSAKDQLAVHKLPYERLRERLVAQGQVLDLPDESELEPIPAPMVSVDPKTLSGIVLDDADAKLEGHWERSTNFKPHIGTGYVHDDQRGDGRSKATWRFRVPQAGRYELRMAYSAHETRAGNVTVVVTDGMHVSDITMSQARPLPAGELFRKIGEVELSANVEVTVSVVNANTDGFVIVDALQLLPVGRNEN